jgi:uncharacterized membrane protein
MTRSKCYLCILQPAMNYFLPCCISCNKQIRDGIYNSTFYPNLLTMLSAFFVLGAIVAFLAYLNGRRHRRNRAAELSPVPLNTAGIVLGIGLGGFIDGIVLHQILQWHEMLSAKIPANNYIGKSVNMFWDGVFHSFCLLVVLTGIALLWRAANNPGVLKSGRPILGGILSGWSIFNLVEGSIDHHWLKLHNVVEYASNHDVANFWFLGLSLLMLFWGMWLTYQNRGLEE